MLTIAANFKGLVVTTAEWAVEKSGFETHIEKCGLLIPSEKIRVMRMKMENI